MNLKIFFLLGFFSILNYAQENDKDKLLLTGSLYSDSKILLQHYEQLPVSQINSDSSPRSLFVAGVLSGLLPGAGQFYNGDYWKTAIFLAVEGALITTAVIYNNKGDDQTAKFETYADQYWSVVRYAQWLIDYHSKEIYIDPDNSLPPWERVNWNELNEAEIGSHHLPPHGQQQYYELIGKYHQYSPGWNDFTGGSNFDLLSPNMIYYSDERGKANDYYNIGDKAVLGVIINHVASVVEAILSANSFNKDLAIKFRVDDLNVVDGHELIPTLMVKYNF